MESSCLMFFSVLGVLAVSFAVQNSKIRSWLSKRFHFSPAPTVLSDSISVGGTGSTARIYLKDDDYYVEGAVCGFSNDADDPYFALQHYSFYEIDESQPYYECSDETRRFIVNMNDVRHVEIWPTIPEE